jgi:hypothetical protein
VSPDAFSKTLNVSSNRANASTLMYWLDNVAGTHACDNLNRLPFRRHLTAMDGGNAGNAGAVVSKRVFEPGERQHTGSTDSRSIGFATTNPGLASDAWTALRQPLLHHFAGLVTPWALLVLRVDRSDGEIVLGRRQILDDVRRQSGVVDDRHSIQVARVRTVINFVAS